MRSIASIVFAVLLSPSCFAGLVTFEIQGRVSCALSTCVGLQEETGLDPLSPDLFVLSALFTVDTDTAPVDQGIDSAFWEFSSPTTGIVLNVGSLTRVESTFTLGLSRFGCDFLTVSGRSFGFEIDTCAAGKEGVLSSYTTLNALASESLKYFSGTVFDTYIESTTASWQLFGGSESVRRVSEPAGGALMLAALFILGLRARNL